MVLLVIVLLIATPADTIGSSGDWCTLGRDSNYEYMYPAVKEDGDVKYTFEKFTNAQLDQLKFMRLYINVFFFDPRNRHGTEEMITYLFSTDSSENKLKKKWLKKGRLPSGLFSDAINSTSSNGDPVRMFQVQLWGECKTRGVHITSGNMAYYRRHSENLDLCDRDNWSNIHHVNIKC